MYKSEYTTPHIRVLKRRYPFQVTEIVFKIDIRAYTPLHFFFYHNVYSLCCLISLILHSRFFSSHHSTLSFELLSSLLPHSQPKAEFSSFADSGSFLPSSRVVNVAPHSIPSGACSGPVSQP